MQELFDAPLFVDITGFGIETCKGAYIVRGRRCLSGIGAQEVTEASIDYYFPRDHDNYLVYHLQDPSKIFQLHDPFPKDELANVDDDRFVQLIGMSSVAQAEVIKHMPDVRCLAGQGLPEASMPRSPASWDTHRHSSGGSLAAPDQQRPR